MADRVPVPAAGVCVVRPGQDGPEILLIRRANAPHQGAWSLPGGRQAFGECIENTARRELLEETGLGVGPMHLIAVIDVIEGARHYLVVDYAALWRGDPARAADDAAAYAWWPVRTLAERPVTDAVIGVARQAVAALAATLSSAAPSACRPAAAASSTDRPR